MPPFNFRTAAAAGRGARQATQPFQTQIVRDFMASKKKEERQRNLSQAYGSLFPDLSGDQLNAVGTLAASGVQLPSQVIGQLNQRTSLDAWIKSQPPEDQSLLSVLPPDALRQIMLSDTQQGLEQLQNVRETEEMIALRGKLPKTPTGEIDWNDQSPDAQKNLARYSVLVDNISTSVSGSNYLKFGQGKHPRYGDVEKEKYGSVEYELSLREAWRHPYYDNLQKLTPEMRKLADKLGLKSQEEWDEHRGVRSVGPKAQITASEAIESGLINILPVSVIDRSDAIKKWNNPAYEGRLDEGVRDYLDKYYTKSGGLKGNMVETKAVQMSRIAENINKLSEFERSHEQVYSDFIVLVNKGKGQGWPIDGTTWALEQGYTQADIDNLKLAVEYFTTNRVDELIKLLEGSNPKLLEAISKEDFSSDILKKE